MPDFGRLALGLVLCCDATVGDDESVIGDPTEAAFVVLAAKMGVGAEETRAALPRRAEVPFDSEYKFMATFHDRPEWMTGGVLHGPHFMTVKGAPDVVIDRCSHALWHGEQVPIADVRDELLAANQQMSEQGLRVLAFAVRDVDDAAMATARTDPMAAVTDLLLVALVGIIDPLRAEAKRRGAGRARRRHRRAHDHRRPHRHRAGDRRPARARARASSPAPSCSSCPTTRCSNGCRSCTSSAASHPRTRCASPG